jgi:DNA-directed RNA polymerase subunit RPC12/RpoP
MDYYINKEVLNETKVFLKTLSYIANVLSLGKGLSYDVAGMLELSNKTNILLGKLYSCEEVKCLDNMGRGQVFECPDCGYKVMREEIDEYLKKIELDNIQ